mmetsp:Transcript_17716/g.49434  ORF Transcript_17716/g.49434 Transcript_17716/m.49434 type:complete len:87 (+) Transcript_17716:1690-1950(+)
MESKATAPTTEETIAQMTEALASKGTDLLDGLPMQKLWLHITVSIFSHAPPPQKTCSYYAESNSKVDRSGQAALKVWQSRPMQKSR